MTWTLIGNIKGPKGNTGNPGAGVPSGGTTGQLLAKASGTDFDDHWIDPPQSSSAWGSITGTLSNQTDLQAALNGKVPSGQGVPAGGTTGQVLAKNSGTDYDDHWVTPSAGVAGSSTQVQFNNGGVLAGDSGLTYDPTNKALSVGGGTVTTSNPVANLSQTWNAGAVTFTGFKFNVTDTASAAASLLADLQVGGSSKFKVDKTGNVIVPVGCCVNGSATTGMIWTGAFGLTLQVNGSTPLTTNGAYVAIRSGGYGLLWGEANDTLALRNSTNPQVLRVYNTDPSGTQANAERGKFGWNTNVLEIGAEATGTGVQRAVKFLGASFTFSNPLKHATFTVATLPSASTSGAGTMACATDLASLTNGSTAVGGGTLKGIVKSDGTNWIVLG